MKKIAVIIPLYNQWGLTQNCLRSLREHTEVEFIEVITVDNGSSDDTPTQCPALGKSLFGEDFQYIRLEKNKNFGPACNLGATQAQTDFLLFLNNDTLLTPMWLDPLVHAFTENPKLGAVGPLLTYPDGRVQHLGVSLSPTSAICHLYHQFPSEHRVVGKKRKLQAITAAALLLPKTVFEQAGGFCEQYRNGFEDLDLCALIRRQGLELTCVPTSRIVHLTSQSQGRFDADRENAALFTSRCREDYMPDEHLFAHEDGFALAFHSDFSPYFVYEQQPGTDIARVWEQVQAEPFWEQGYAALLCFFREKKMWAEALELLQMQQAFFYSYECVVEILRVATRLGRKDILMDAQTQLAALTEKQKTALKRCLRAREHALRAQDTILLSACDTWLASYAPGLVK